MDKEQVVKLTRKFALSLIGDFDLQKVVLYGSWAHGHPHEDSDIDIAVIVKDFKSDYLDLLTKLYHKASDIDIRIEPTLFEENRDDSGFLSQILTHGEIHYENSAV